MDTLDKDIKRIKIARMKPEEKFLYEIFCDIETFKSEIFYKSIFYIKNNVILFEYDCSKKMLCFDEFKIWYVLEKKFEIYDSKIYETIKKMSERCLNIEIDKLDVLRPNTLIQVERELLYKFSENYHHKAQ
jgi:hypothetical protein